MSHNMRIYNILGNYLDRKAFYIPIYFGRFDSEISNLKKIHAIMHGVYVCRALVPCDFLQKKVSTHLFCQSMRVSMGFYPISYMKCTNTNIVLLETDS